MTTVPRTLTCPFHRPRQRASRPQRRPGAVTPPPMPTGRVPRVARLLAVAHRCQQLIQAGVIANYATLAQLGHLSRAFGQWQKLALARGFMRNRPLLLVLDEPTAALDAETEHALFEGYAAAASSSRKSNSAADNNAGQDDGRITILAWDFGDGLPSNTFNPTYTYSSPGSYRVTLIVWDDTGRAARVEKTIAIVR